MTPLFIYYYTQDAVLKSGHKKYKLFTYKKECFYDFVAKYTKTEIFIQKKSKIL